MRIQSLFIFGSLILVLAACAAPGATQTPTKTSSSAQNATAQATVSPQPPVELLSPSPINTPKAGLETKTSADIISTPTSSIETTVTSIPTKTIPATASQTPTPEASATLKYTSTSTETPTPEASATNTVKPTNTPKPTKTLAPTRTPRPTKTPTSTPTEEPPLTCILNDPKSCDSNFAKYFAELHKYYNGKPDTIKVLPDAIFLILKDPKNNIHAGGYEYINEKDFNSIFSGKPYNVLQADLPACREENLYPFKAGWNDTDFWTVKEGEMQYFTTTLDTDQIPPKKICLWYRSEISPEDNTILLKFLNK